MWYRRQRKWQRAVQSGSGAMGAKSVSSGKVLPDTLTCAQVLTSSEQPWGLLRQSFSLWNEHGQLFSPSESGLLGKRGKPKRQGERQVKSSFFPLFPTWCPSLTAEELASSPRFLDPLLTARPPPHSFCLCWKSCHSHLTQFVSPSNQPQNGPGLCPAAGCVCPPGWKGGKRRTYKVSASKQRLGK